jgi:hypothetical protein
VKATAQIYEQDVGAGGGTYVGRALGPPSSDVVGVGQGFFLECNTVDTCPTQVTLDKSGRTSGDRDVIGYKNTSAKTLPSQFASLSLSLAVEADGDTVSTDEAATVLFYDEASAGWGRYDATKLAPFDWKYATIAPLSAAGDTLRRTAQVGLPWPTSTAPIEVPIDLTTVNLSGTATVQLADVRQAGGWTVELVDTKGTADPADDVTHTLRRDGAGYQFPLAAAKARTKAAAATGPAPDSARSRRRAGPGALTLTERLSDATTGRRGPAKTAAPEARARATAAPTARFRLRITPAASALPVELSQFGVQARDRAAVLQWQTASETDNSGFYVQHQALAPDDSTADDGEWRRLGFIEGSGTTEQPQSYRFETDRLEVGRHAFRLAQVDADGTTYRTDVETLSIRLRSAYQIKGPFPNPARRQARLPITVQTQQHVSVAIYDVLGRRVKTVRDGVLDAQDTESVRLPTRGLASGAYFVRVRGESFVETRRLTVVK